MSFEDVHLALESLCQEFPVKVERKQNENGLNGRMPRLYVRMPIIIRRRDADLLLVRMPPRSTLSWIMSLFLSQKCKHFLVERARRQTCCRSWSVNIRVCVLPVLRDDAYVRLRLRRKAELLNFSFIL